MRVGIDGRYIQDQYHGIGRYMYEVARHLARSFPNDEWLIFHDPRQTNSRFDMQTLAANSNLKMVEVKLPLFLPQQQLSWPRLLHKHGIDCFHTPYFDAPWFARCPMLITIHDLIFDRFPDFIPQRHLLPIYRILTTIGVHRAARIVTISEATKRDIIELYGVNPAKISVIPEAAATDFCPASPGAVEEVRKRYRLPAKFVLTLGTMRPQKNIPNLLRAFARIVDRTDAKLVLAGTIDPRWPDDITPLIAELDLAQRIVQPGHIAEADLPALYSAATLFAFPSLIEGFGLPPLEAMSCGTAVVSSSCSSLPEVVGNAGLLVDPQNVEQLASALLQILENPELRQSLEQKSVQRAALFNWESTAKQTMAAYKRTL